MHSNILVLVVDGLRASALGAYGNTTYSTLALDQFATRSLLFDEFYADSVDLAAIYRALLYSRHPARQAQEPAGELGGDDLPSAGSLFAEKGFHTALVTDDPFVAELPGVREFQECELVEIASDLAPARAADLSFTSLVRFFSALSEHVYQGGGRSRHTKPASKSLPRLVWAHTKGMYGAWDAPVEVQEDLLQGESTVVNETAVPDDMRVDERDPDIAFRYGAAYAAQIIALDAGLQLLFDVVESLEAHDPWQLVVLGSRGFPLGEHGTIGGIDHALSVEQLHVPCMIQFPHGKGKLARSAALSSHLDILPTLLEVAGITYDNNRLDGRTLATESDGGVASGREWLLAASGGGSIALRTTAWCLRAEKGADSDQVRQESAPHTENSEPMLFVRPDDRWEANDVSKLCPDVVDELTHLANSVCQDFKSTQLASKPNL